MLREIVTRLHQGFRTSGYPAEAPVLPPRYRGLPRIRAPHCPDGCTGCTAGCPTGAVQVDGSAVGIDMGKCLFCGACADACPGHRIEFTREYRLAARRRDDLWVKSDRVHEVAQALRESTQRLFGRSLRLRQVSAGGCGACEADVNVLGTLVFDMGRFGIEFVASPRHADGLLVTGPVSRNMSLALKKTWEAIPSPKIAIAVGACAISGGPFAGSKQVEDGAEPVIPVDLFVPGCPPHPYTVLDGLLRMLGRIPEVRPRP